MEKSDSMEQSILEARERARLNLVAFRHVVLNNEEGEVEPAPFHYDWSDALLEGDGHECFEAFRESAKSQYILRSFPLYQLCFPQSRFDYILIIKNNSTLAGNKLKEIAEEYTHNKALSANLVEIQQQSGDVFHVKTRNSEGEIIETRIEAYGKGASIRGSVYQDKRPKICIIDDPQDVADLKSDKIPDDDWKWFLGDVIFLGKNTRIFLIGNNLGDRCIVERVMNNAATLGFKPHRIPVERDGKPTWPAMFSPLAIVKEKESYRRVGQLDIWLRERMCQSTSEETRTFNVGDFPRFSHTEANRIAAASKLFATLDPAASQNPEACFRSICVNAVTVENYWMIIEMLYGRWDSSVLINKIFATVSKWALKDFGIEKGMLFDFMAPLLRAEMARRQIFFNLVPLEHGKKGTKLERIKMLAPRSKAKTIWLPDLAEPVDDLPSWITELELELNGVTKDALKSEYNDLLDSLAMQDQIATAPSAYGNPATGNAPSYARGSKPPLPRTYSNGPTF